MSELLMAAADYRLHPCGLMVPRVKRHTAIDLFSGCGGMSLGLIQAGFEVVAAVDYDCLAMETYGVNLGANPLTIHFVAPEDRERMEKSLTRKSKDRRGGLRTISVSGSGWISGHPEAAPVQHVWIGDVRKLKGGDILNAIGMRQGEVDLVCGGPPCQGFSTSGRQDVMDPRNSLVFEWARLVQEIKPKALMMENVPGIVGMVTPEGIPVVDALCRVLEDGDFGTFDAIKRSLLATSGAGAALAGKRLQKTEDPEREQLAMFG